MYLFAASLLAATLTAPGPAAGPKFDAGSRARDVAPFLDDRTVAVLHVDLAAADANALLDRVAAVGKLQARDLAEPRQELAALVKALTGAGARHLYVVASLIDVPGEPPFVVVPLAQDADAKPLMEQLERLRLAKELGYEKELHYEKIGRVVVGGSEATRKRLRALRPVPRPEVAEALAGAGPALAQLVLVPTADTRRVLEEVMPTLPEEVGGGPVKPLSRGLQWAALSIDAAPKLAVRLTVQTPDDASARALHGLLVRASTALGRQKAVQALVPDYDKVAHLLTPRPSGDRLTLTLDEPTLAPLLRPHLRQLRGSAERRRAANNLRQVLAAMHGYEAAHGRFPAAAVYDKKGRPLLSWRVQLLPDLGEAALYKQFRLDEPWDSPHNKKLIAQMPAVFRSSADPKLAAAGKTTYLAPLGEATLFTGRVGVRVAEVTDGTSYTISLVDADDAHAVVWTRPEDLTYDPKDPAKGLATRVDGSFMLGFADGAVHFLPRTTEKATLHALFTRNGGEVVNVPW
jgi:hypothetical protein